MRFLKKIRFKISYNIIIWVVVLALLIASDILNLSNKNTENEVTIVQYFLFVLIHFIIPIYVHHFVLIKKLFYKRQYPLYCLSVVLLVIFITTLSVLIFNTDNWFNIITIELLSLIIGAGFFMTLEALSNKIKLDSVKEVQSEIELKLLREQVNPHFLYNALNSAYNLALFKPDKAADVILKLSQLFRYSLESGKEQKVPLLDEIKFIENYIELQKLRIDKAKISCTKHIEDYNYNIVPMLLITFVENSFKHGVLASAKESYVTIEIKTKNNTLFFEISNSVHTQTKQPTSKIGLKNAQKRLEVMYPNKHQLEILEKDTTFTIKLAIDL